MAKIIDLPTFKDKRGALAVAEVKKQLPFSIRRMFYLTQVPALEKRGFHAHKKTDLALICAQGTVTVAMEDCKSKQKISLKTHQMVIIPAQVWHSMEKFTKNTVVICLASQTYAEKDYIRNYEQFRKEICS